MTINIKPYMVLDMDTRIGALLADIERLRAELDKAHDAIRYTLAQLEYMRMLWGGEGVTDGIATRLREALEEVGP